MKIVIIFNETVKSLEICYLEDIYLSRIEFNKLFYELELLKPIEQTPQNNEIEELKKELEELKDMVNMLYHPS